MAREPRKKSETGIYHIMLRGSNRKEIFHDDEDYIKFLEILQKYKCEQKIELYGWCLMGNHLHLLIKEGLEDISSTMKRIGVSYVWFYNNKYKTTGHLFQDRFRSESVEDDKYLLTVLRYIHQNPLKARMVDNIADWRWSSCQGYYGLKQYPIGLLDSRFILGMFSSNERKAVKLFKEFNEAINQDKCLDEDSIKKLTDEEAKKEIEKKMEGYIITDIRSLPKTCRDGLLKQIKEIEGISNRQAARILGISANILFKA